MNKLSKDDFFLALAACPFLKNDDAWSILNNYLQLNQSSFVSNFSLLHKFCLDRKSLKLIVNWFQDFKLSQFQKQLVTEGVFVINGNSNIYPTILKETSSPPPFIFYKGNIKLLNSFHEAFCLAVVGSRNNTLYGEQALKSIINPICQLNNVVIISGLARGVDTLAHIIALNNNCPTIAVLGSGLFQRSLYPPENISLASNIVNSSGLIMSEFPPDMPPKGKNFPQRNRIIAGLSKATLVVEAAERSGALITARYALECNREVLAVPGNIFYPSAKGVNKLIQKGAYPVTSHEDIINYFK